MSYTISEKCETRATHQGSVETASPLKKKQQLLVNNNYLKMYRNIFIFIKNMLLKMLLKI
jgi:hypothetical protein